ncbi:MAG: cytochrome c oxidase assembly protein [Alteromonadaceae bacterium]|nr:MAG: cytochrome c oxidase assembly protein [Alteromonadaceae bacterium]
MNENDNNEHKALQKTVTKLVSLCVAMFVFAVWVMPPMYDLFCEVTGINGKTASQYQAMSADVDTSRTVKVKFVAINNSEMPWAFKPKDYTIEVHPGQAMTTHFIAHNPTSKIMVGQAVPSMVPSNAANYFHKTECFCFNRQTLAPGERAELGLRFIVDQDLPKRVGTIVLSYSLFDVTEQSPDEVESKAQEIANKSAQASANTVQNSREIKTLEFM